MHEIKIYGNISNIAESSDKDVTLLDVQKQLKEAKGQDIICRINSNGGDADEGFAIYHELRRYAKENNAKIKTFGESRLGSIATVIFLAGDERELTDELQPFIHKAFYNTDEEITDSQKELLRKFNERIANHYASHTDLTFEEALELMDKETHIDTYLAKEMRFATSIENVLRPVALKRFTNNTNIINKQMSNTNTSILNKIANFLEGIKNGTPTILNKVLFDANGVEIDFYELSEDDVAKVGDKARVDGQDAQGNYVMQSTGDTYAFDKGVLIEILAKVEDDSEEVEALKNENAELKEKLEEVMTASNSAIENLKAENSKKDIVISNFQKANSATVKADTNPVNRNLNTNNKEVVISNSIKSLIK